MAWIDDFDRMGVVIVLRNAVRRATYWFRTRVEWKLEKRWSSYAGSLDIMSNTFTCFYIPLTMRHPSIRKSWH
jgi:hypothetical protein